MADDVLGNATVRTIWPKCFRRLHSIRPIGAVRPVPARVSHPEVSGPTRAADDSHRAGCQIIAAAAS